MNLSITEAQIHSFLDQVSNGENEPVPEELIEAAGEEFKQALRKQFTPRDPEFRIRMSNIGRPLCQLQMDKAGTPKPRMPYNHVMRMLIGDSTEVLVRLVMKMAGVNVTSDGDKVTLDVAGTTIKGDSDIDIDNRVYDIKSSSPWGFANKWELGYQAVAEKDTFGYVGQLLGYADAQDKELGGWVVVDKSAGTVAVVDMEANEDELARLRKDRENVVVTLENDYPFMRQFEPVEETYYGKPTGAVLVPDECKFCDFHRACWPEAEQHAPPKSKAKNPVKKWYVKHPDMKEPA